MSEYSNLSLPYNTTYLTHRARYIIMCTKLLCLPLDNLEIMEENTSDQLQEQQTTNQPVDNQTAQQAEEITTTASSDQQTQPADQTDNTQEPAAQPDKATEDSASDEPDVELLSAEQLKDKSEDDLVAYMKELTKSQSARKVMNTVRDLRNEFSRRFDELKKQALENLKLQNENPEEEITEKDVDVKPSDANNLFQELYKNFEAALKAEREAQLKIQEENAEKKQKLIDDLKAIVENTTDNPSSLLTTVKNINAAWKEIGSVPSEKKEMNNEFRRLSDKFFENLNKERDLRKYDEKHNLEEKTKLCEEAEKLGTLDNISQAFFQMQRLHANWKAIGQVPHADRDAIWERFKAATSIVNKRFHKKAEEDHEKEKINLEAKTKLCEEAEAVANSNPQSAKAFEDATKKIIELQKQWRTFGFAPKEVNEKIYARFRQVCDSVFDAKRAFYKEQSSKFDENVKLKEALCEKAEAVMNSTDWKETANLLINLQKQWKEIGQVGYRQGEALWKRFRTACDKFFENRNNQLEGDQAEMQENLAKKQAIIDELKGFVVPEDENEYLKAMQSIMQRWNAIGFVPIQNKQTINKEYSDLISKHFDALNLDKVGGEIEKFRSKMEAFASDKDRLYKERKHLQSLLSQASQDIETQENNIAFFSKSKNSESIVAEVRAKIEKARENRDLIAKKLAVIEDML